ncbi:MAG: hypothetical protein SFU56_05305 [Capsulimonadales bacterium]|nr:hypothetical protein [Capsulimonadales bacterium]
MTIEDRLVLAKRLWDWSPHEGQHAFLTLRLDDGSEPKTLVAACGRRWGKTEALSVDIATRLLTIPEEAHLVVGPTADQAVGLFDAIEEKLREVRENEALIQEFPHLRDFEFRRSPYCHIRRSSDGQTVLSARSAAKRGRNLRGKGTTRKLKRFRVTVDEAAFVEDAAITEALQPMLATVPGGGQLVLISSPYGRRGVFYEAYLRGERREGRYRSVRLPSSQNPLVDPVFLAEKEAELAPRQFAAEYRAEFVDSAGAVFPTEDIEQCLTEDDYGPEPLFGMVYVAGIDLARRGDFTVVAIGAAERDRLRLVTLHRLTGLNWRRQIDQVCDLLARWNVRRVCPDRTGIGDMPVETLQAEIVARRLRCELADFYFTESGKRRLIDGLAIGLSRRQLAIPRNPVLLSELANFEVTGTTGAGRERMEARVGHDDTVIALALMLEAAAPFRRRTPVPFGAVAGRRRIGPFDPRTGPDAAHFSTGKEQEVPCESPDSICAASLPPLALTVRERVLRDAVTALSRFAVGRAALARWGRKR